MDRRCFLKLGTILTACGSMTPDFCKSGPALGPAAPVWRNRQEGVQYKALGNTGMMISRVTMGSFYVGPKHLDNVRLAMDMGLNYIDTAPAYMHYDSEGGYGELFRTPSFRQRVFVQTKVSLFDNNRNALFGKLFRAQDPAVQARLRQQADELMREREVLAPDYFGNYGSWQLEEIRAASLAAVMNAQYGHRIEKRKEYYALIIRQVEASLRKMRTDHIDVLCCPHGANTPEELNISEVFEAAERLKKDGKIGHLGFSAHTDSAGNLRGALQSGQYETTQVAYNPLNEQRVAPAVAEAAKSGMGVIAMKVARCILPVNQANADAELIHRIRSLVPGTLSTPARAYALMLKDSNLAAVVSEMEEPSYVKENMSLITA